MLASESLYIAVHKEEENSTISQFIYYNMKNEKNLVINQ